jgi:hypothetical protein
MNLENFDAQELNAYEMKNIEGGTWYSEFVDGFRAGTGDKAVRSDMTFSWYSVGYGWDVTMKEQVW